jgi:single-stranded-DNA-specific exonuclease
VSQGDSTQKALLGVQQSLLGKQWVLSEGNDRLGMAFSQRLGIPEIVGRILSSRGVQSDKAAENFLEPTLRDSLPDPSHLKDMDKATDRICQAIETGETMAVFGDYDVDGATSSALLKRYFDALGSALRIYIPDRIKEGYGPNVKAFQTLKSEGASLVITVDCGTTAFDALEGAQEMGLDVIVMDHHVAESKLPSAVAVVNPNRLDQDSSVKSVAAVGLCFLLCVSLNRALRNRGFFKDRSEPDLKQFLDLVALGTVCDVVSLSGLNRAYVSQGLKVMANRRNTGLSVLGEVAGLSERPEAYHAGFVLGPRINAGGRVGESSLGGRLLSSDDPHEAKIISLRLNELNKERQEIEARVLQEATEQVESRGKDLPPFLLLSQEGWHPGVIGIVAGRLKDRYHRPVGVVAIDDEGVGKGSGRSVSGVDLGTAIHGARQSGLLTAGGGHAMAAGFTVSADALSQFEAFMIERVAQQMKESDYTPKLMVEGILTPAGASKDFIQVLSQLAPFGMGNPTPRFVFPNVKVINASIVGNDHIRCLIQGEDGKSLAAIAFRSVETPLGDVLLSKQRTLLHLAGTLRVDSWQGRETVKLTIEDGANV